MLQHAVHNSTILRLHFLLASTVKVGTDERFEPSLVFPGHTQSFAHAHGLLDFQESVDAFQQTL